MSLAVAVYVRNRKSPAHRAFVAAIIFIVAWLTCAFISDQPAFAAASLLFNRLTLGLAIAMGASLINFAVLFPVETSSRSRGWRVFLTLSAAIAVMTMFTPLVAESVEHSRYSTDVVPGPLFTLWAAWTVLGVLLLVAILARKYNMLGGREKAQLKYLFLGFGMFTVTALILGLIIPLVTGSYRLSELNTFSSLFLVGFTSYAMIKHRFMDIRAVALRSAAYLLLVGMLSLLLVAAAVIARAELMQRLGIHPDVLFAGVSLAAIFVFQPIRHALEHFTDALFYRKTYDPQVLLARLGSAMSATLDLSDLEFTLTRELMTGMRLSSSQAVHTIAEKTQVVGSGRELDATLVGGLLENCRRTIVYADDPKADQTLTRALNELDIRVMVPLVSDGAVLGGLLLGPKLSGEMFSAQDDAFLRILQAEASIAVRNALLFEERNQRVRELTALNTLAWALGRDTHFEALLDGALAEVMNVTSAEAGSIMLVQPDGALRIECARGIPDAVVASTRVELGEGIAGWVAANRRPLVLVDADDRGFGSEPYAAGARSALSVPLVCKGEVTGVLNVSKVSSDESFSTENQKVVASFAGQLAMAIDNAKLYIDLENTFLGTIGALASAVDAKDPYTFGHSSAVTEYALSAGKALGLSAGELETLRIAALLHDIGKIGIDSAILNKPGRLAPDEYVMIQRHPDIAANILSSLDFLKDVVPYVQYHHERWDGTGYPTGMSGESIPLGARIISVADAFDAMTSERPYRPGMSYSEAIEELKACAGTQFDANVVEAFVQSVPGLSPQVLSV